MSWSQTYNNEAVMLSNLVDPTDHQKVRLIKLRVLKNGKYIRPKLPTNKKEKALLDQMYNVAKSEFIKEQI